MHKRVFVIGHSNTIKRTFIRMFECQKQFQLPPTVSVSPGFHTSNTVHNFVIISCFVTVLRTCKDAFNKGNKESGIYKITPDDGASFQVYCDMNTDNGGWTVFQRRVNGTVNFIRGWEEYKAGFGDLGGNFWLGLEKIHRLTKAVQGAVLRVDLRHWNGAYGYAKYTTFKVNDESDKYRLTVENYSGNASDSLSIHNGMYFSTIDRDNDAYSNFACAASRFRGGWWYNKCMLSDLNGEYPTETEGSAPAKFMTWFKFITLWDFGNVIFSEMKMK